MTRLKDEFLATLSHELRTPLNGILGWGRLLQSGSLDDGKRQNALNAIVRNASAQNQLIDDLLDVSRIVSGKFRLNVGPVHLHAVIEAALDVMRPAADAKGVALQAVLDADAGLIQGDPGRLQQVIWNLLANAVKFTPKGGRVQVTPAARGLLRRGRRGRYGLGGRARLPSVRLRPLSPAGRRASRGARAASGWVSRS